MDESKRRRRTQDKDVSCCRSAVEPVATGLLSLPDEVLELCALYLPFAALLRLALCHSRLRDGTMSERVWQALYQRHFPHGPQSDDSAGWRLSYLRAIRGSYFWWLLVSTL
eukprot:TRINITY_DN507_c0_g4_i1.p1 TRINITY_DN507_c0_g4~~TRINITY_DN507_c0_g4_i1.p1  ORF type:complete len:111 (-),score=9.71 TRINITY_DN507_c0_g4_i1:219-551(-)